LHAAVPELEINVGSSKRAPRRRQAGILPEVYFEGGAVEILAFGMLKAKVPELVR
jgi:hypothetical protein